jgi:hypothetical protein
MGKLVSSMKLLGKVQTACLSHSNWSGPQVSEEQAAKVPRPNPQAFRENFHPTVFQPTLTDQP